MTEIEALAEKLWHGAGWTFPLANASAHHQDEYRQLARFLQKSGWLK